MLGRGFYANQHLYQAQKNHYGFYILKAQVYGIKTFLFLDREAYMDVFQGKNSSDFIVTQIKERVSDSTLASRMEKVVERLASAKSVDIARALVFNFGRTLSQYFGGLVYTGGFDKESIVAWFPEKQIRPLEYSADNGATWESVDNFRESKGSEISSALTIAIGLVERLSKYSEDTVVKHILSRLSRFKSESKAHDVKNLVEEILKETNPSLLKALQSYSAQSK